jgi:hypothetical protein
MFLVSVLNANIGRVGRANGERAEYFGGNDMINGVSTSGSSRSGNHDYTEFTMGRILIPQTFFDMLDLLEILRRCR